MIIVKIKRHPFGGDFTAINLFGVIFTLRDLSPSELNHELIHTAQQRELLYVPFLSGMLWSGLFCVSSIVIHSRPISISVLKKRLINISMILII